MGWIVKFKNPLLQAMDTGAHFTATDSQGNAQGVRVLSSRPGEPWGTVQLLGPEQVQRDVLEKLVADGHIESFQQENTFYPLGELHGVRPHAENTMGWDFPTAGVTETWQDATYYGDGCIIGVADTGLPPSTARGPYETVLVDAVAGCPQDTHGHSTAVGFRIGGILGVLPECRLVFAAALPGGSGNTTTVVNAIRALVQYGVQVINLSLGGPVDPVIDQEIAAAHRAGVCTVAAVGNGGPNDSIGSPARSAHIVVGATVLDGSRPASFSSGGCQWEVETCASPGENVGLAHLDGGYGTGSGTSFSAPFVSGVVAGLMKRQGWSPMQAKEYLLSHQVPFPGMQTRSKLLHVQASDIGDGQVADEQWKTDIYETCDEVKRIIEQAQAVGWASDDMQSRLGSIWNYMDQVKGYVPKVNGGTPPPPVTKTDSFGGTYGPEHGLAFDLYPNGEDGPHKGVVFKCPAAGTVSRYSFGPGPLGALRCYSENEFGIHQTRTGGQADVLADLMLTEDQRKAIALLGTYMHIAVLHFDQPQQDITDIWIGHVRDGFPTGRRNKGDDFAVCWNSGVEFPNCDASHGHVCGTRTGSLSPNGDVPGLEVARLLGFNPRVTVVPGPQDYYTGRWDRGKPRG